MTGAAARTSAPPLENVNEAARLAVGLQVAFGDSWKWDVNLQSARSNFEKATSNNVINANMLRAIDAVRVTSANVGSSGLALGSVACRSTLSAPANGCVPVNLFGSSTPTAATSARTAFRCMVCPACSATTPTACTA